MSHFPLKRKEKTSHVIAFVCCFGFCFEDCLWEITSFQESRAVMKEAFIHQWCGLVKSGEKRFFAFQPLTPSSNEADLITSEWAAKS
ncbi:hypothetical protein TNIN_283781 [Trichonephila inaurata madagascariensis]|uniref:Uncharacterized protein n=1 Tax=Trichonephila inaurata madagascariensis TaxID=2747483 RepID=A0A8X6YUH6_9ARAC|nr:hypothetical protein TNIN_283781 [Trichonephila inaurata madagascariensis]